jgi:hypothetical protein
MNKILPFFCLIILCCSCQSGASDSPKKTAAAFIEAAKQGDIDAIKKQITKSDAGLLEMGENFLSQLDSSGSSKLSDEMKKSFSAQTKAATIEIKEEKIEGNRATVNVKFSKDGRSETRPFNLLKEDGKWKISLLSTGLQNTGAKQQDINNMLQSSNLDSLKETISKSMKAFTQINKDSLKKTIKERMKEVEKRMKVEEKADEFPKQHS